MAGVCTLATTYISVLLCEEAAVIMKLALAVLFSVVLVATCYRWDLDDNAYRQVGVNLKAEAVGASSGTFRYANLFYRSSAQK